MSRSLTSTSNIPVHLSKGSPRAVHYSQWPGLFAVLGMVMLLLGFAWPQVADPRSTWTEEKAKEYTQASAALHQAAHSDSHEGHDHEGHHHQHELEAARQRFEQLKQQLDASRDRPQNVSLLLKLGGGILVGLGAISLLIQRASQ